jgi:nucleotide-binding universal stress UspA family protein
MFDLASPSVAITRTPAKPSLVSGVQDEPKRRVVIPLDGSPASEAIVPIVARLTRQLSCEIVLLHAVGCFASDEGAELQRQARATQTASAYLATIAGRLRDDGFTQIRRSIWYKDPAPAIRAAATSEQVDLIAMATTGELGPTRAGTGVAAAVMQSTRVPLLLARGSSSWLGALEHVVVPLDSSSADATVLPIVSAISEPQRTRIHLVRAIDPARRLDRRYAELYLATVAATLHNQGLLTDSSVIQDESPVGIARFATQVGAQLITMATSMRADSGFTRQVLNATHAASPVLLLRPGLSQAATPSDMRFGSRPHRLSGVSADWQPSRRESVRRNKTQRH